MTNTRIFIHGLESSNKGTKSVFFRERYPDMIIPTFVGLLEERMGLLERILSGKSDIILVGSSFGGLMASLFAFTHETLVTRMILLAPALNFFESAFRVEKPISVPVWIYHGKDDQVIPLTSIENITDRLFSNLSMNVVDDDHYLHRTFKAMDWDSLLLS